MASTKHFLDLSAVSAEDLRLIMEDAKTRKTNLKAGKGDKPLAGKMLAMIFEKPSTRTRVSFDVGMRQLGGETLFLSGTEMQLGRAETIGDTAKVLSRYVDAIMIRTTDHSRLLELAEHATVPVINGLTDATHPCQIMADIMTFEEHRGNVAGKTIAWTGDGNNVLHSLIEGSARFGYRMNMAVPLGSEPDDKYLNWARNNGGNVMLSHDAEKAVSGADCVVTDTWVSMNQEHRARGHNVFQPFQVNGALMKHAKPDALFMHCLPAHRGEEVTDEVIDGAQSVVFDEAENRLHAQKSVLAWCLGAI
jgi:ornithine carbamoyltransferase